MLRILISVFLFFSSVFLSVALDWVMPLWWGLLVLPALFLRPWLGFLLLTFFLGFWRVQGYEALRPEIPYGSFLELEGKIVEEVDRRMDHQKITLETKYGRVLVKFGLYHDFHFGDRVAVEGILEAPSQDIDGFSYANYLARYRIWSTMNDPRLVEIEPAPPSWRGALYDFKGFLEIKIYKLYFEPEASFVAGLLLGSRKGMPQVLADAFQATGLTHIVAISGYNISLIVALMFTLASFLPLKTRVVATTLAIVLFVILVGASAAVVRAGIMGVITLWGLFWGSRSQVFFTLLWSAVLMVLMNPYTLIYDVGFQLSFTSTLGLLVFVPMLESFVPKAERFSLLREALLLTLAAQIGTLPLILFHFGRLAVLSPIANVLVAPFLPLSMLFSALSLVFGETLAILAYVPLRAVELVALAFSKIPFVNVSLALSVSWFLLSEVFLLWLSLKFYKSTLRRAFRL